jgi:hypothetical protein
LNTLNKNNPFYPFLVKPLLGKDSETFWSNGGIKNSKSQITNTKQITMTEIVRASLGLPTLRAGPQFQNSKTVLVI